MPWRKACLFFCAVLLIVGCSPKNNQSDLDLTTLEEWDLVIIGDSTLWGIGENIAEHIEKDYGIKVNLHDFSIPNLTAVQTLESVRSSEPDTPNARMYGWPEIIKEAEYIVLHPSPAESISSSNPGDWSCMYPPYYVDDCSIKTLEQFQSDLREIINGIQDLRAGQPVIIRLGSYWGRPGNWESDGAVAECRLCLETYSAAIEQVANEYGIPFISFLDILNGADHSLEPDDLGYIGVDSVHMSEEGMRLLSNQIWELGVSPTKP